VTEADSRDDAAGARSTSHGRIRRASGGLAERRSDAKAGEPPFGRFDVQTVFFISKSDDHNRVDYGIHLDEHCVSTRNDAVYLYWREFERAPPVVVHTPGLLDFVGYGISEQRVLFRAPNVGVHFVTLRQLPTMPVQIITTQGAGGRCTAQARSTINGKDLETGQEVIERVRK
jgi:hypothetical protein